MIEIDEEEQLLLPEDRLGPYTVHMLSRVTIRHYIRMAKEIAQTLGKREAHLLDWGCGFGQLSLLLQNRGFHVTSYDVATDNITKPSELYPSVSIEYGSHPYLLSYGDQSFDAVIACGVLEHVPDPDRSLGELWRVLIAGGYLFIYNLPQRLSWKEAIIGLTRLGYSHERRYSLRTAMKLLEEAGFTIVRSRRAMFLPSNLTGAPQLLRRSYGRLAGSVIFIDSVLAGIPLLNRVAESLELIGVKQD